MSSSTWRRKSAASAPTAPTPGRYFYANMAMALHLIEQARLTA
jgi:hypothetical protein